ncbi:uncharacterized protein AMSG_08973 [Thecamonas trahens ATCC 50062]|uniref:Uncharacterized protein n=1 Tax=Thecamonas trahens ATCC 50062 TaxID=461836 RepID=A0A0L0DLB3_THETB|nr:hypothetical protein AMSG_08973 [Thecamonas trahens ATCC 50062]KNC52831.1 hypothetical protein AMSG_08973 [Thecamonas trahens ATCC 50062]|eukprot:XP_013754936.1 hypothetical protein AMSG_08973 [Thecamonas trahens ATCC 50062]
MASRRGLVWLHAAVEARASGKVYLTAVCPSHGALETLVCSDAGFFRRIMASATAAVPRAVLAKPTVDVEDLDALLSPAGSRAAAPLTLDTSPRALPASWPRFLAGGRSCSSCARWAPRASARSTTPPPPSPPSLHPAGRTPTPTALRHCSSSWPHDRLAAIAALDDSVLLRPRVHPTVSHYLAKGKEQQALAELDALLATLSTISDIGLILHVVVDAPPATPRLDGLLALFRAHPGLARMLILSQERAPKALVGRLTRAKRNISSPARASPRRPPAREHLVLSPSSDAGPSESGSPAAPAPPASPAALDDSLPVPESQLRSPTQVTVQARPTSCGSVDPLPLLRALGAATAGELAVDDFVPLSHAAVLEQLLKSLGFGWYNIRPSPFCAFASVIVNGGQFDSVPLSRIVDVEALHAGLLPEARRLEAGESLGLFMSRRIRKAIKAAQLYPLPDILSYLAADSGPKADAANAVLANLQLVVVHNMMDLASMDLERRCSCAAVTEARGGGVVATCGGGCI